MARLMYILAHGTKEGLVEKPEEWPGVHCVRALLTGEPVAEGVWFDRTREFNARLRGEAFDRRKYTKVETVTLSPLPCWQHLTPEAYRARIANLVCMIKQQAREAREATGIRPLGVKAILAQKPTDRPARPKKSSARPDRSKRLVVRASTAADAWRGLIDSVL